MVLPPDSITNLDYTNRDGNKNRFEKVFDYNKNRFRLIKKITLNCNLSDDQVRAYLDEARDAWIKFYAQFETERVSAALSYMNGYLVYDSSSTYEEKKWLFSKLYEGISLSEAPSLTERQLSLGGSCINFGTRLDSMNDKDMSLIFISGDLNIQKEIEKFMAGIYDKKIVILSPEKRDEYGLSSCFNLVTSRISESSISSSNLEPITEDTIEFIFRENTEPAKEPLKYYDFEDEGIIVTIDPIDERLRIAEKHGILTIEY